MINNKLSAASLLTILLLSICLVAAQSVAAQTDDVTVKLQAANTAVEQAFNAVSAAEKAGANVTDLLNQLNGATDLLAQAQNAYRIGDNIESLNSANAVLPIAQKVTSQAQAAKESANVTNQNSFWSTIALAIMGSFVFILVLFLVWRRFKRKYINNLTDSKPEVNS